MTKLEECESIGTWGEEEKNTREEQEYDTKPWRGIKNELIKCGEKLVM
jgi:hypothetical protein